MGTHYRGTPAEVRALDAYIKLMRCADAVAVRLDAQLAPHGVNESQFGVLEALLHLGPLAQRDLGRKLFVSRANVTLLVDQLQARGWVRRVRSAEDRRLVTVELTADGRRKIERLFPLQLEAIVREFAKLSAAEQVTLGRLCKKLGLGT